MPKHFCFILILLMSCQMPFAALAASSGEHLEPYEKVMTWQDLVDRDASAELAKIGARVVPSVQASASAKELKSNVRDDRASGVPEPQLRGADWLDYKAILQVDFTAPVDAQSALSKMQFEFDGRRIPLRLATDADLALFHWPPDQTKSNAVTVVANNLERLAPSKTGVFKILAGVKSNDGLTQSTKTAEQAIIGQEKNLQLTTTLQTAYVGQSWPFQFSAPILSENLKYRTGDWQMIDGAHADTSMIVVDPPVANLKIYTYGFGLLLKGDTLPDTTYHVTFKGNLPGFGCTLATDTKATVRVTGVAYPHLLNTRLPSAILAVPHGGRLIYPVYSFSEKLLHVKVRPYRADREDV
ncbi:MAG: hypothetical protein KGS72_00940, partial [Cyanobacteria bacterium REEB67]|nr:hypothetical protein [Cyanobacteria bacterium REEB67]